MHKAMAIVAALLIVGTGVLLARDMAHADFTDYDANGNGVLEKGEVLAVVIDYFRDEVTKDEVLEVLVFYFLSDASPEPTPTPTPPSSEEDVTAPELVEVILEPSEVDVSSGDVTLMVTVRASDDLSGVQVGLMEFYSPSGKQSFGINMDPWVSTAEIGHREYVGTKTLSQFSESGTWQVTYATLTDYAGNNREYRLPELTSMGLADAFEVMAEQEDAKAPELIAVTFNPAEVDVSLGDVTLIITVRASDDLSGVRVGLVEFYSPSGRQSFGINMDPWVSTAEMGHREYVGSKTLSQFSESGTWQVTYATLTDYAGNTREYWLPELTALGLTDAFEVVRE